MIIYFKIFEKQLKLFQFDKPTDSEIAHAIIDKHKKLKPSTPNLKTNYQSLKDAFEQCSKESLLNDTLEDEIKNSIGGISDSVLGIELLLKNQWDLIEYIVDDPDLATDEFHNVAEKGNEHDVKDEIDELDDWYYHLDNIVKDPEKFEKYFLDKHKNKLFKELDTEYYDDLRRAIFDSDDPNKLLVYRAMTLPTNIEELEDLEETGIGEFWTYDFDAAKSYWSKHDREFVFGAYVDVNCIDWLETIQKSLYGLKEEREVKIIAGSELELINVFMKGFFNEDEDEYTSQKEKDRIKNLFSKHEAPSIPTNQYLKAKHRDMSYINFEEPILVEA
jgi:hypothetical protein